MNSNVLLEKEKSGFRVSVVRNETEIGFRVYRGEKPLFDIPAALRPVVAELLNDAKRSIGKWASILSGEKVILSDRELDILCNYFKSDDSEEAALFFSNLVSIPDPGQVGVIPLYLVWLR